MDYIDFMWLKFGLIVLAAFVIGVIAGFIGRR